MIILQTFFYLLLLILYLTLSIYLLYSNYNIHSLSFNSLFCSLPFFSNTLSSTSLTTTSSSTSSSSSSSYKKQYYRLLTSSFCHSSYLHVILDILLLWDLRLVVTLPDAGLGYFLRYSLLLILLQKILILFIFQIIIKYYPQYELFFQSIHIVGISGLIFSWFGYLAVKLPSNSTIIHLFTFIPLNIIYIPTILILLYQIILPKSPNNIGCMSGLFCGLFLGFGLLDIMPNIYWTLCFLINIFIFLGKSWYETMTISGSGIGNSYDNSHHHPHHNLNQIDIHTNEPIRNGQIVIDHPFESIGRIQRDSMDIV